MNKKFFKKALALSVTAIASATAILGATACDNGGDSGKKYDNEKDAVVFSSQPFDLVFNPFYSTSAMDANAVGMTQIGMIGNNKNGEPAYGDDEAVVTKDLEIREIKSSPNTVEKTEYYFVLKNNVRFSNGSYLTMKDVLFNMYVYLDPAYTGSSTMYSTDIVGLKEYRTQSDDEREQDAFERQFNIAAQGRIQNLVSAIKAVKKAHTQSNMTSEQMIKYLEDYAKENGGESGPYGHAVADYKKADELFNEELESDWNNSRDSYADTKFTNAKGKVISDLFTTDVEVFLFNEGVITWDKNENGGEGALKSSATNNVAEFKTWTKEEAIDLVYANNAPLKMEEVVQYWAYTSTELSIYIAGNAKTDYFKEHPQNYKRIKGIEFANMTSPVTVNGVTYKVPTYDNPDIKDRTRVVDGYEVLKVTINEIDPKAIWNFSFGVAPMWYYSDQERIDAFDYTENFGVKWNDQDFQSNVLKGGKKIGVPVGAGPYMACDSTGNTKDIDRGDFLANNVMYFKANPHFLMGEPVIKNLQYQVVSSNQIMNSLQTGGIDFGEPNATKETESKLDGLKNNGLEYSKIQTAGYGYVGINASKVPSIYVRRAIMHCIDQSLAIKYYGGTGAEPIYRSMSLSSWAYPKGTLPYYPYIGGKIPEELDQVYSEYADYVTDLGLKPGDTMSEQQQIDYIKYLVEDLGGYSLGGNGIYRNGNDVLNYTFTIAGQENDHPAFTAMYQAGQFLTNKVKGFQIITKPDNTALTKLSSGGLAVWAAAWGSTIDPDMYQVYHMDSRATSTLNWGYNSIKNNTTKYEEEYGIIQELSDYIERARKLNDQTLRAELYKHALDLVMELAVELPMYQRDDLFAYNSLKIDTSTFTPEYDRSAFKGLTADIYKLSLVTVREK